VSSLVSAGAAGLAAGLGIAVPLGAVGVLLVSEGMARGWRPGVAAACGVATVDLVYASAATAAGAAVASALAGRETAVRLVAATVLAVVAVRGLLAARAPSGVTSSGVTTGGVTTGGVTTGGVTTGGEDDHRPGALRSYWRFVAVTAVNPLTALYFVALAVALGDRIAGTAAAAAFVLGVGIGSLAWQLVLAGMGAGAGSLFGPRGRRWTALVGNGWVLVLAVAVALGPAVARS